MSTLQEANSTAGASQPRSSSDSPAVEAILNAAMFGVDEFVQNFATLVEAFRGTQRLKSFVLDLAIRGQLTRQQPEDGDAASLLDRMTLERAKAKARGTVVDGASGGLDGDKPFVLPASWTWAELAQVWKVVTDGDHQPPPKSDTGVAFLTIGKYPFTPPCFLITKGIDGRIRS